VFYSIP